MREMKDSGVEWIGKIPENWQVKQLKRITYIQTGSTPQKAQQDLYYSDDGIPWIKPDNLSEDTPIIATEEYISEAGKNVARIFPANTVYVCCIGAGIGKVGFSLLPCSCNQQINALRFNTQMYWKYGYYLTRAQESQYVLYGNGNVIPIINGLNQGMIMCPIPSKIQQKSIADYLDVKCKNINTIIIDVQHQIELLQEYKQSVITEAVTKGLDKNVAMKNSGIEWIPQIPKTWSITRIGYSSWLRARLGWKGLKAEEYTQEGYCFLSAFNIINDKLYWGELNFINQSRYDESPEIKLKIGDILLVKDGAGIGKCARIDELPYGESTANGSLAVISTYKNLYYKYLYYYFLSSPFQNYIQRIMNGMGVPHLSQEELRKIVIPLPETEVQKNISNYLDKLCGKIDSILTDKQKQLDTLTEYKKSLIYEYVTGKKEVPADA